MSVEARSWDLLSDICAARGEVPAGIRQAVTPPAGIYAAPPSPAGTVPSFILHIKIIKQVGVVHIPDFDHILQSYNAADTALHTGKFLYRIIVFDENKGNGNSAHCCHRQISQLRIDMETILQDKQNHDP